MWGNKLLQQSVHYLFLIKLHVKKKSNQFYEWKSNCNWCVSKGNSRLSLYKIWHDTEAVFPKWLSQQIVNCFINSLTALTAKIQNKKAPVVIQMFKTLTLCHCTESRTNQKLDGMFKVTQPFTSRGLRFFFPQWKGKEI